jgi:hypothetical protein
MKNILLQVMYWLVTLAKWLSLILATAGILISVLFIAGQTNLTSFGTAWPDLNFTTSVVEDEAGNSIFKKGLGAITLAEFTIGIFLSFLLKYVFLFFCFQLLQQITTSVTKWRTFSQQNVLNFRKLGFWLLLTALTQVLSYAAFADGLGGKISVIVPFNWLVAALSAFVLAEIFKEGSQLAEEQKLTV